MLKSEATEKTQRRWLKRLRIPIAVISVLIILTILVLALLQDQIKRDDADAEDTMPINCSNTCSITLIESIPENITFIDGSPVHMTIFDSWVELINSAKETIDMAMLYFTLTGEEVQPVDPHPSAWMGEKIYDDLLKAGKDRGVKMRIVQSEPTVKWPDINTKDLEDAGAAEVRSVDIAKLIGPGVLHTKMFIVDNKHIYIGSANMNWRSFSQVLELGVTIHDCPCLAHDLYKIFEVYWKVGEKNPSIPRIWPTALSTTINKETPAMLNSNNNAQVFSYIASTPVVLSPKGRTSDLDSILDTIERAKKFIYIAVRDYFPISIYTDKPNYWPVIDDALRRAAVIKRLQVRIMASYWNHTIPTMMTYLRSLDALRNELFDIEVKLFVVPTYTEAQARIPFSRENHNKFMVTDNSAYIGTSNWSEDYFVNTAGVAIVFRDPPKNTTKKIHPIRKQVEEVFIRDWTSEYAIPIANFSNVI